jgi:SAM-dependent methyltransferase
MYICRIANMKIASALEKASRRKEALSNRSKVTDETTESFYISNGGYCNNCDQNVMFCSSNSWLRDFYACSKCGSVPRERAIIRVIEAELPDWRSLKIHESSPAARGASYKLKRLCADYTETQYFPQSAPGEYVDGFRNENLEQMTFEDDTFDLVVSLDVMEHVYNPADAFREVSRTLKDGGMYIFTVPMINKHSPSQRWAKQDKDGSTIFLHEPEYHLNPVDSKGSAVTVHWGYDITEYIKRVSGMDAKIVDHYSSHLGIAGEYTEVVVAIKNPQIPYTLSSIRWVLDKIVNPTKEL